MRRSLLLLAAASALVGAASGSGLNASSSARAAPASTAPVLGIERRPGGIAWLSRYDPITLKAVTAKRLRLAGHGGSWAFSPDGRSLAIGSGQKPSIRIVDPTSLRLRGDVRLADPAGAVSWVTWLRSDRLLAIANRGSSGVYVVAVDPRSRRVLRRTAVDAVPWQGARLRDGLVLLLGSSDGIQAAQLAVVDADGSVRRLTVPRIAIGTQGDHDQNDVFRHQGPGLAVDPEGRRAFLVGAVGVVAEIELGSLAVSYHRAVASRRVPAAASKAVDGPYREAKWLGGGLLAVSGSDSTAWKDAGGKVQWRSVAAGLSLVDTRTWRERTIHPEASRFRVAGQLLLAQGGSFDSVTQESRSVGLVAYRLDGAETWRLFDGEEAFVERLGGGLAYVVLDGARLAVVELATRQVVATHPRPRTNWWPGLLTGATSDR